MVCCTMRVRTIHTRGLIKFRALGIFIISSDLSIWADTATAAVGGGEFPLPARTATVITGNNIDLGIYLSAETVHWTITVSKKKSNECWQRSPTTNERNIHVCVCVRLSVRDWRMNRKPIRYRDKNVIWVLSILFDREITYKMRKSSLQNYEWNIWIRI